MASDQWMKLTINEETFALGRHVPTTTSLLQFIREFAGLPGTKGLCSEGGCGICAVVVTIPDVEKDGSKTFSVHACQTLVYSCIGWSIVTVEHLEKECNGFSMIQSSLHQFYGTQCGFCSPGFLMTMHSLMTSPSKLKVETIEKALDGNMCRCTGYRPILDAFKCFAHDAPQNLSAKLRDIEEAHKGECGGRGINCDGKCHYRSSYKDHVFNPQRTLTIKGERITWHRPKTLVDLYGIMRQTRASDRLYFVVGSTAQGVFKNDGPYDVYIDIKAIEELSKVNTQGKKLLIGANVSLTRCIELFLKAGGKKEYRSLQEVGEYWGKVANVAVRNAASWAGNLMIKKRHPGFGSDIFLSLVALEATITVNRGGKRTFKLSPEELVLIDMSNTIIVSMEIPSQTGNVYLKSYKITPRAVNCRAYVNACFKFEVESRGKNLKLSRRPVLVFGGISPSFVHAVRVEEFLTGRCLANVDHLKQAIKLLGEELEPDRCPEDAAPQFRRSLAQCLLYKAFLAMRGSYLSTRLRSGGVKLERPISRGEQKFDASEASWPIGQAIPKLESQKQLTGKAAYLDDLPYLPNELFGCFVQSTLAKGKIHCIDASRCLKLPSVVDFIKASDVPGDNTFHGEPDSDPVFATDHIKYAGQSIGLVVAKTKLAAEEGAKMVKIVYKDVRRPILTIKDAIKQGRIQKDINLFTLTTDPTLVGDVEEGFKNSKNVFEGELELGSQFHFTMEPLAARVIPVEDQYKVYCTTQGSTLTQTIVANNLGITTNRVSVCTRRIGGGFGGKISRQNIVASAAAVAAHKLKKPVRVVLNLTTHMTLVGWREPYLAKYKVGFSSDGLFEAISVNIYADVGHIANECSTTLAIETLASVYTCPNWRLQGYRAITDTAANTWCRSPGHTEAIGIMENLIERIAVWLKKDPQEIRELNFAGVNRPFLFGHSQENLVKSDILPLLKKEASVAPRMKGVAEFNEQHRWRKRGMSVIPLRYGFESIPLYHYNVQVVIYEHDGSVAITHGGIEMGQGINTKVAQVAAKTLRVPLHHIEIKPDNVFTGANSAVTAGSRGSDLSPYGVLICCKRIRERMDEVERKMVAANQEISWKELVKKCFQEQVDICERYFTFHKEHPRAYDIWAAVCLELELDILTGQFLILRTDIIEDCGRSLSPFVDIGQIEGAFVMGLGFYTSEEVKFDHETGQKLSNGTLEYFPPSALDIPVDFRVSFMPGGANQSNILGSKATGEPAVCLSYVVVSALREAITAARKEAGITTWFEMDTPLTVEKIHQLCKIDASKFAF